MSTTTQTIAGAKTFSTSVISPIHSTGSANPATTGIFRLSNNESVSWRNAANSGHVSITVDGSDIVQIGSNTVLTGTGKATAFITATANPATIGVLRLANTEGVSWRNAANGADISLILNSSNVFTLGGPLSVTGGITASTTLTATTSLLLNGSSSGTLTTSVPASVTSYTLTYPSAQGANNQYLTNNGSGTLSWVYNILHGTTGALRVIAAKITNNGTAAIAAQSGGLVSVQRNAAGEVQIVYTGFSVAPYVIAIPIASSFFANIKTGSDPTTTTTSILTSSDAGSNVDKDFMVFIIGTSS
jgi:hypothetical protein